MIEQILSKVVLSHDGCWLFLGKKQQKAYMTLKFEKKIYQAHRFFYEFFIGPIPKGLQIDHLCRTPSCCHPKHLEPVTSRENSARGEGFVGQNLRKTHCPKGHEFNQDNTYYVLKKSGFFSRNCRPCRTEQTRNYRNLNREKIRAYDRARSRKVKQA
jgi:hypothetical protein